MIVCLTGAPGSGKSAIAAELHRRGWRVVSAGAMMRQRAIELGIDISTMQEEAARDDALDRAIDAASAQVVAAEGEKVLMDARMAWLFAPSPKVCVKVGVDAATAAERVFRANRPDEAYQSVEEAQAALERRRAQEVARYRTLYKTSYEDDSVTFDLEFDTAHMSPAEIADAIEEYVAELG